MYVASGLPWSLQDVHVLMLEVQRSHTEKDKVIEQLKAQQRHILYIHVHAHTQCTHHTNIHQCIHILQVCVCIGVCIKCIHLACTTMHAPCNHVHLWFSLSLSVSRQRSPSHSSPRSPLPPKGPDSIQLQPNPSYCSVERGHQ